MEYRVFKPTYTSGGTARASGTYHIAFRDHLARRQSFAGSVRERDTQRTAERLGELVQCRRTGERPPEKLQRWIETLPDRQMKRLLAMELIDPRTMQADRPLAALLDSDGADPGYRQALLARGDTDAHVKQTIDRIRAVLDECGFAFWRDLAKPGAPTSVEVFLGKRRKAGKINGQSFNYYVRAIKGFCRWLAEADRAPFVALASLKGVKNAEMDREGRRALSIEEMRPLLQAANTGGEHNGLTGAERAILYRFSFESGCRPNQVRSLTVADFNLGAEPPTVTAQAKFVKRRTAHTQVLRQAMAAELKALFATKMPEAPAFKMPSKYHMAEMLRRDLAAARAKWVGEAESHDDRMERERSDFLAPKDREGNRTDFYSLRHGHGTALADAGVPAKDIQASMHHTNPTTTARYLHTSRKSAAAAIGAMPDLSYPLAQLATGTAGPEHHPDLRNPCATGCTSLDSAGREAEFRADTKSPDYRGNTGKSAVAASNARNSPRGGTADATDLKSVDPKWSCGFESHRGQCSC